MKIQWTSPALADLARLHAFLVDVNPAAAARAVQLLTKGARGLRDHPRLGMRVGGFEPREVRRLIVGAYELRYEIADERVLVLRLWHTREDR